MRSSRITAVAALALAAGLALTGCTSPSEEPEEPSGGDGGIPVDQALADAVPAEFRDAGVLKVATDATYPPFENMEGDEVVGFDADMANAIGDVLDLDIEFVNMSFDAIIPALQAGQADMALSSMGDNKEREKVVDFATYYWNGTLLLVTSGNPKGGTPELSCDMTVGVVRGSLQQTQFLPAQKVPCEDAGKQPPTESVFQNSNQAILALQANRIDGVLIDAPVVNESANQSGGALEAAGPIMRNPNPGGVAFPKGSELVESVNGAINVLIESGKYAEFLKAWNLDAIAIDESEINGALQ